MNSKELNDYICNMDHLELNNTIQSVIRRFSELYPEEECVWLTLPQRDLPQRRRILPRLVNLLEKGKQG